MPENSKILYIVTQSEFGGAQRYILDLATNLPIEHYHVAVAAGGNGELFAKLKEKNIRTYQLKNLVREINPIKDLKAYFEIKKLLKKSKPDVLHLNSSKAGVLGAVAGRHAGIKKIIYTVHGFVFNEPLPWWKKQIYLWTEKFSTRYKDKLICVSEFDRQVGIKNKIKPKKLITINNGVDKLAILDKQTARTKLNLPIDKKIIGTIAHFYPTKGLFYLIQAAQVVVKQFPQTIFAIIGDGQLKNQLEHEINKLNLKNNFLLLGSKQKAGQYVSAFDIYVSSSVKEGFPFSILEAMAAGLPIASTNVGGIPEMIKDNVSGLLVESKSSDALAQALLKILQNKNLVKKLGSQAKIRVAQKFSLQKMIQETKKLYLKIMTD